MLKGFYDDESKIFFPYFGYRNLRATLQSYPKYSQKFCGEIGIEKFSMQISGLSFRASCI
jgi:hypothetical protein